jgi:hypothetical protein
MRLADSQYSAKLLCCVVSEFYWLQVGRTTVDEKKCTFSAFEPLSDAHKRRMSSSVCHNSFPRPAAPALREFNVYILNIEMVILFLSRELGDYCALDCASTALDCDPIAIVLCCRYWLFIFPLKGVIAITLRNNFNFHQVCSRMLLNMVVCLSRELVRVRCWHPPRQV